MKLINGIQNSPWKICIYAPPGIGKSTLASQAPKPLMIDLEKGLDRIDAAKTPYITKWETGSDDAPGLLEAMRFAATSDFETIVFDTAEGIENILLQKVLNEHSQDALASFGYGKGFELFQSEFIKFMDILDMLVAKGKNVLIIAHDEIKKFEDPTSESYDRYKIRLNKRLVGPLTDRMDAVLFGRYETFVKNKGEKDFSGNDKKRAIGEGKRVIHTEERPAYIAKNRFGLPETIDFNESIYKLFN